MQCEPRQRRRTAIGAPRKRPLNRRPVRLVQTTDGPEMTPSAHLLER
jgi:hypothetical protein